jgi:hypothetical protein
VSTRNVANEYSDDDDEDDDVDDDDGGGFTFFAITFITSARDHCALGRSNIAADDTGTHSIEMTSTASAATYGGIVTVSDVIVVFADTSVGVGGSGSGAGSAV